MHAEETCRGCGKDFELTGDIRRICCDGRDCGCYAAVLPDEFCSVSCWENYEPPEDDGECFRGSEAAAFERDEQARIQRELK